MKVNKSKKNTMVYVTLPSVLIERLNEIAQKEFTTPSAVIREAIFQSLRDRDIKLKVHKAYLEGLTEWETQKGTSA